MNGLNNNKFAPVRKYTDIGYFNEARQNQKYVEAYEAEKAQQEKAKKQEQNEKTM